MSVPMTNLLRNWNFGREYGNFGFV